MSLFSKLNQIKDLRQQGKKLQNQLAEESVTVDKHGVFLTMDGNQKLIKVNINPELLSPDKKTRLEETLKDLHNEAIQKIQKIMVEKMRADGSFKIPGLN
ncbi:MAG: YbaB/EbfC family nucleoid-associated protein [Patescibacteria group bacterium]|jgi:DNA-binding protein YbaB